MTDENKSLAEMEDIRINLPSYVVIVIVEDDRGHYLLTKNCLRTAGISNEIIWLEDGQSALDFFFGDHPGKDHKQYIVLLDIRLPKVEGTVILEKLKNDPKFASVPVVMLTTSEDQRVARHCYELGCEAHVVKPPGKALLMAIRSIRSRI